MTQAIHSLIQQECRLLDQGKLDDWLELYADDAIYWLPIDETVDPMKDSSVIYDNKARLAMRVEQIMRQRRVSQTPGSETMRMISNLEVTETDPEHAQASFSMLVIEVRSGDWRQQGLGETRLFPGYGKMLFRLDSGRWTIVNKTVVLLNRKQPLVGLAFLI